MKNHENYNKEMESFYMCNWTKFDFLKYDIFKIESNELILKVAEYYVINNIYSNFKKFISLYPESLNYLNYFYLALINNYENIIKTNNEKNLVNVDFCCEFKLSKFFKYFYKKGFSIKNNLYIVLNNEKNFWKYFVKLIEEYNFNIDDEKFVNIFNYLCICHVNNDLLAFIDNYNIDHLIRDRGLRSCVENTINSNMIKYFLNRIRQNKIVFDTSNILNVYDTSCYNEIILEEIKKTVEHNQKLTSLQQYQLKCCVYKSN